MAHPSPNLPPVPYSAPMSPLDPLPTTAAFDAALGPTLLVLLDTHDAVRTDLARLMDETEQESEDAEAQADGLQRVVAQSEYLDELREALARELRQRRNAVVRANDVAGPEIDGKDAPS